jgi:hypothetical protein
MTQLPPPLWLRVLDSIADDIENVSTLHDGTTGPDDVAADEEELVAAIRELLHRGLIEAYGAESNERVPEPKDDDMSLREYWFRPTPEGTREWRRGWRILDAYYLRSADRSEQSE